MKYTQYKEVNEIIDEILCSLEIILSDDLVGMYLHGSLVTGDFDHTVSDIDLLVVTQDYLDNKTLRDIRLLHERISVKHPDWDDRIEVAYLSKEALRTFKMKRSTIGIISPGEKFHTIQAGKDWLMSWFIVREHSKIISGPDPKNLIEPITFQEYSDCVKNHLGIFPELLKKNYRQGFQAYVILTMCRGLQTVIERTYASKKKSAKWAMQRFPEWADLINDALIWRLDKAGNKKDDNASHLKTAEFVEFTLKIIKNR